MAGKSKLPANSSADRQRFAVKPSGRKRPREVNQLESLLQILDHPTPVREQELLAELNTERERREESEQQLAAIGEELKQRDERLAKQGQDFVVLRNAWEQLKEQAEDRERGLQQRVGELEAMIETLATAFHEMEAEVQQRAQVLHEVEADREALRNQVADEQHARHLAEQQVVEREEQRAALAERLRFADEAAHRASDVALELRATIETQLNEQRQLEQSVANQVQQIATLQAHEAATSANAQAALVAANQRATSLARELAAQSERLRAGEQELCELRTLLAQQTEKCAALEKQQESIQARATVGVQRHVEELAELAQRFDEQLRDGQAMKDEADELRRLLQAASEKARTTADEQSSELERLQARVRDLDVELDAAVRARQFADLQYSQVVADLDAANVMSARLQRQADDVRRESEAVISALRESLVEVTDSLAAERNRRADDQREFERRLAERQDELAHLHKELDGALAQVLREAAARRKAEGSLGTSSEANEDSVQSLAEAMRRIERLTSEVNAYKNQERLLKQTVTRKLVAAKVEIARLNEQIAALEAQRNM